MRVQRHKVPRDLVPAEKISRSKHALLIVHADTVAKAQAALAGGADYIIFGGDIFSSRQLPRQSYAEVAGLAQNYGKNFSHSDNRVIVVKRSELPDSRAVCLLAAVEAGAF